MKYVRKAVPNDVSRIAEILIFTKRTQYRPIFQNDQVSFGEMQVLPLVEELLSAPDKLDGYWVYDDAFVKGILCLSGKEVKELYVEPFFQGQGVGGALLEFAVSERGADTLWVLEKNEKAIRFYRSHGFEPTGERCLEEGTTEYIMKMTRRNKEGEKGCLFLEGESC